MKSSKSELSKALRKLGLRIIKIAADGNCLFRAVAHQLYVDVSRHEELRQQCCEYMVTHRTHYEHYVEGCFDAYIQKMEQDSTWGGNLEITAMSEMCDRKITIHSKDDVKEMNDKLKEQQQQQQTPMTLPTAQPTTATTNHSTVTKLDKTVPALVLKHDFETSASAATPRPLHSKIPDPIQLSYHGQSHYNSVVDPRTPLPLAPLLTSYIRQGRMLRDAPTTTVTGSGGGEHTASNKSKKKKPGPPVKNKKSERLAFFRFRSKKKSSSEVLISPPPTTASSPRCLSPLTTTPTVTAPADADVAGAASTVTDSRVKHRHDRQRPSLPSLPPSKNTKNAPSTSNTSKSDRALEGSSDPSAGTSPEFVVKADEMLKRNMEQLDARIAQKLISENKKKVISKYAVEKQ